MVARGGTVVIVGILSGSVMFTDFSIAKIPYTETVSFEVANMEQASEGLQDVARKVKNGVFKAEVFRSVFPLEKIGDAHGCMEENKAVREVIMTI